MSEIPNAFYRVSIKALILDETRTKFLIMREENGGWELPGGAFEYGANPQEDLTREIEEEMKLEVVSIAEHPSYFYSTYFERTGVWKGIVVYETSVKDLDFTPSDECTEIAFVSPEEIQNYQAFETVIELGKLFDARRHTT